MKEGKDNKDNSTNCRFTSRFAERGICPAEFVECVPKPESFTPTIPTHAHAHGRRDLSERRGIGSSQGPKGVLPGGYHIV